MVSSTLTLQRKAQAAALVWAQVAWQPCLRCCLRTSPVSRDRQIALARLWVVPAGQTPATSHLRLTMSRDGLIPGVHATMTGASLAGVAHSPARGGEMTTTARTDAGGRLAARVHAAKPTSEPCAQRRNPAAREVRAASSGRSTGGSCSRI
jgi:hypothetical protein